MPLLTIQPQNQSPTYPFGPIDNKTAHSTPPTQITLGQKAKMPMPAQQSNALPSSQAAAPSPFTTTGNTASVMSSWPGGGPNVPSVGGPGNNGLFGQLINRLSNFGLSQEQKDAFAQQQRLELGMEAGLQDIQRVPKALETAQGQAAAMERNYGLQMSQANKRLELANLQRGQELEGLTSATGLIQPISTPFTAPLTSPLNPSAPGDTIAAQIPSYVQKINSGQMTFDDAVSALGNNPYYTAQLQSYMSGVNPNLNVSASNTIGTPQYQTLLNSFNTTTHHMRDTLDSIKKLPLTDFPVINAAINGAQWAMGSTAYQNYKTKLDVTRAEIAKILGGGEATDQARAEAESVFPNNLGPDQLEAAINAATQLMNEKVQSYGSLGGGAVTTQAQNPQTNYSAPGTQGGVGWF